VNQLGLEEISAEIKTRKIDILGISLLTTSVVITTQIIKDVRSQLPKTRIVLGNVHASMFSDDLLKDNLADFIIHREGEYTFLELVKALKDNTDLQKIKGLSYRKDDQIVHTKPRPLIEDLDELSLSGASPQSAFYIGNDYRMDVLGARAAGLTPILIDRDNLFPYADCLRFESLTKCLDLLDSE
jgi:radical SAM superfamily enzyme YgiQ (UPF0313 family)